MAARDAASAKRDATVAARDTAVAARDAALADAAKATEERDRAVREKAAVEHELTAATRARDKARQERNEWLTRARDAAAGQGTAGKEAAPAGREPSTTRSCRQEPSPAGQEPSPTAREQPAPPPAAKPRKAQIPPGGILLPPSGPGSHMRRSILPGRAPRVLAPILLVRPRGGDRPADRLGAPGLVGRK